MIRSYKEYREYLEADRIALRRGERVLWFDEVWRFQRALRRVEYLMNCRKHQGPLWRLRYIIATFRLHRLSLRCGFDIPPNTFGPGLSIAHRGTIVVHPDARIGRNCRLHVGVVIGTRPGPFELVPTIGDNCYIGPGAKIFGDIVIGPNIAIGANSVVNRSFTEGHMTIAGAPARKVSDTDSREFIIATRSPLKSLG
ncbi:MAG: serine acetyltransferase [Flavobacteriales bacterium]|nr:UDP-3-O-(3-hydroxymyristoyl)glucosamine N-acyltransferase [Flavobacteriales bacterium]MCC6576454.1 serine acetyltransferase [Flavobacteriales bacterium]NUQ16052.1 serine acetyltransferase [Flavobacteriales bacterium]